MKAKKDRSVSKFALSMLLVVVLVLSTGLAIQSKEGRSVKNEPREFLNHLLSQDRYTNPWELADRIIQEDPTLVLIDLRDTQSYKAFSLPGAINMTPDSLIGSAQLTEQWAKRELVLFDDDERLTNTTWLLAKQIGYKDIYVLRGGLNSWFDQILQSGAADKDLSEVSENQSLRKASSMYFGVHQDLPPYVLKEDAKITQRKRTSTPKKEVTTKPKKKKAMPEGGC